MVPPPSVSNHLLRLVGRVTNDLPSLQAIVYGPLITPHLRPPQHFNKNTFMEEEKVYTEEVSHTASSCVLGVRHHHQQRRASPPPLSPQQGIPFVRVPFIDNQPVLDLIEKKPFGLLNLLDEEVRRTHIVMSHESNLLYKKVRRTHIWCDLRVPYSMRR
jgi:hypothetical protein